MFVLNLKSIKEALTFRTLIVISPIFFITVKHWINTVLLILFFGSIRFLLDSYSITFRKLFDSRWRFILSLSLIAPLLAVSIGQILRHELFLPNYDAPLRIALCAPIFLAISFGWLSNNINEGESCITTIWGKYILPLTIIWTFLYRPSWTNNWGNRVTTYFVDPLSFGSLTLLLSFLVFYTLSTYFTKLNWLFKFISFISIPIGLYLSVLSGSRSGWLAIPICFLVWLKIFGTPNYGIKKSVLVVLLASSVAIIIFSQNPFLVAKSAQVLDALLNYSWSKVNTDGDNVRISMYRMAYFYFINNPFLGWGDLGWMRIMNSPELSLFSTEEALTIPIHGFHNEILTNSVRSGVWGLASSLALFLTPLFWGFKLIKNDQKYIGGFLTFFTIFYLITGLTTEVTNLVFLSSFLGITIAVTAGEGLYRLVISKI